MGSGDATTPLTPPLHYIYCCDSFNSQETKGLQSIPYANASDAARAATIAGSKASQFSLERFGSVVEGDGGVFWTFRRVEPPLHVTTSDTLSTARHVRLTLHTAALGLAPRSDGYTFAEIAQPDSAAISPVVVSTSAIIVDVHLPDLPHNTTFVLHLKV